MNARGRPVPFCRRSAYRLAAFLVLSLSVHAAILLAWEPHAQLRAVAGSELVVSLAYVESPARAPTEIRSTSARASRQPAEGSERRMPQTRAAQPRPKAAGPAATSAAGEAPSTGGETARAPAESAASLAPPLAEPDDSSPRDALDARGAAELPAPAETENPAPRPRIPQATARTQVRELLLADIARYFEYPWIARRRGWQGMVRLSVTVRPDGALEGIRVTETSGYEVLDRSAVETMQRVGQLAQAGRWLDGRALELPLAIVYRLTD